MTTICALREPGRGVWIASDSMATNNETKILGVEKWIVREPWAIGFAGDARTGHLAAHNADAILDNPTSAWQVSNRIREVLRADGYSHDGSDYGAQNYGQSMIIAHYSGVWRVDCCFSATALQDGQFWADGSGRRYALGAAHALMATAGVAAETVIRSAVAAAIKYDSGSGGEIFAHFIADKRE
jgi:ATP-dependent protease HslVU (ClpYQ) peptidase subunit